MYLFLPHEQREKLMKIARVGLRTRGELKYFQASQVLLEQTFPVIVLLNGNSEWKDVCVHTTLASILFVIYIEPCG